MPVMFFADTKKTSIAINADQILYIERIGENDEECRIHFAAPGTSVDVINSMDVVRRNMVQAMKDAKRYRR